MATTLKDTQQCSFSIVFKDARGNQAQVDGKPEWFIDNTDLVAITPSEDGMSCLVVPRGPLGTCTLSMKADTDRTDGVKAISGTADISIVAGDAVAVDLQPGLPVDIPEETPPAPAPSNVPTGTV